MKKTLKKRYRNVKCFFGAHILKEKEIFPRGYKHVYCTNCSYEHIVNPDGYILDIKLYQHINILDRCKTIHDLEEYSNSFYHVKYTI